MDIKVRNLNAEAYRRLKAWASARGVTIGTALGDLIRERIPGNHTPLRSFGELPAEDFGRGSER